MTIGIRIDLHGIWHGDIPLQFMNACALHIQLDNDKIDTYETVPSSAVSHSGSGVGRICLRCSETKTRINYAEIPSHAAGGEVLIRLLLLTYDDFITIGT